MKFLDRQAEMRRLVRLHEEGRGGFVAVWGRRRIGKSELMKAWCRATGGLYAVADRSLSQALSRRHRVGRTACQRNRRTAGRVGHRTLEAARAAA